MSLWGNVIGDLNARRGKVHSMTNRASAQVVDAEVPLATMFARPCNTGLLFRVRL